MAKKDKDNEEVVSLDDILCKDFLTKHSKFESFEDIISKSGVKLENADDYDNLFKDRKFNDYIKKNSDFSNYAEMLQAAGNEYLKDK